MPTLGFRVEMTFGTNAEHKIVCHPSCMGFSDGRCLLFSGKDLGPEGVRLDECSAMSQAVFDMPESAGNKHG